DAWRIMQEAQANGDEEVAADLLSQAIAILEPRAARDDGARFMLAQARDSRDRVRHVVRVGPPQGPPIQRFLLEAGEGFRAAGLWKATDGLCVLDLGRQVLYRTDTSGTHLITILEAGETYDSEPLGKLITAAWSPPRGSDDDGQLLLVDSVRSFVAMN